MEFVEEWKKEEVKATLKAVEDFKATIEKMQEEKKQGIYYYKCANQRLYTLSTLKEETKLQLITNGVESHFKELQNKVELTIGKIVKIGNITNNLYSFIGENGECKIEVILAGGYNIQKLHTRWLIKK